MHKVKMTKKTRKALTLLLAGSFAFNTMLTAAPSSAEAKSCFTVSKKSGTYVKPFKTVLKVKKGYKAYYKTSGKFKTGKLVKSQKKKTFSIKKSTTLSVIVLKNTIKPKAKELNGKKYKGKIKKYKYTIKTAPSKNTTTDTSGAQDSGGTTAKPQPSNQDEANSNGPAFTVKDGVLTKGNFDGVRIVVIPDTVKKIGEGVFEMLQNVEDVYIPEGVTEIGKDAFNDCSGLKSITLPSTLEKIDDYAFFGCSNLTRVKVELNETVYTDAEAENTVSGETEFTPPCALREVGEGAFFSCKRLKSFDVVQYLDTIGDYAFGDCDQMTSITFNPDMTEIPNQVCINCDNIDCVGLPTKIKRIGNRAFENCLNLNMVWGLDSAGLKEIGNRAFYNCSGLSEIATGAESIGDYAFTNTSGVQRLELAEGVKTVGDSAFEECGLFQTVEIPASVEEIGDKSFACGAIKEYEVREQNKKYKDIDGVLFDKSGDILISYPAKRGADSTGADGAEGEDGTNGENAGNGQEGETLTPAEETLAENQIYSVPDKTTTIGDGAFLNAYALVKVTLPDTVTKIEENAFQQSGIKEINLPDKLKEIGEEAFSMTSLSEIIIPDSVTTLGDGAFSYCGDVHKISIGKGIKRIPARCFLRSKGIDGLVIPAGIDVIDSTAFSGSSLDFSHMDFSANRNFTVDENGVLFSADKKTLLRYPDRGMNDEEEEENFDLSKWAQTYKVPDNVEKIADGAFLIGDTTYINKLYIGKNVKEMGKYCFGYITPFFGSVSAPEQLDGCIMIGEEDSRAYTYAKDNNIAFFTEECVPNAKIIEMKAGEKQTFHIGGAIRGNTLYFSSNENIAKVDHYTGEIIGVANGKTTVIASTGSYNTGCMVTVTGGGEPKDDSPYRDYYRSPDNAEFVGKEWYYPYVQYNRQKVLHEDYFPAVYQYSGNDYRYIISTFHGEDSSYFKSNMNPDFGKDYGQYKKIGENLSKELRQFQLPQNTVLYRGTSYISDLTGASATVSDMLKAIGNEAKMISVSSTSLKHSVASNFSGLGASSAVLEIYADKGNAPGMFIAPFSQYPGEVEYLLDRNITFEVLDAGVRVDESKMDRILEDNNADIFERYMKLHIK